MFFLFFFFSSRRRHTRSYGDWSSDVCSSDLVPRPSTHAFAAGRALVDGRGTDFGELGLAVATTVLASAVALAFLRSEERRVGKECRSRWWRDHERKNDGERWWVRKVWCSVIE